MGGARAQPSLNVESQAAENALRGDQARALAENPLLRQSLDDIEQQYMVAWMESESEDVAGRERLYMAVRAIQEFRRHLRTLMDNGRLGREHLLKLRNDK